MLAPQANNNRFGSKEKKLKATLKFSAAFKTKVSCAGASGAGLSCRWGLTAVRAGGHEQGKVRGDEALDHA